jgi:hypothetical protein
MKQTENVQDEIEKLRDKIAMLNNNVWHRRLKHGNYQKWEDNFSKEECGIPMLRQKRAALHLLSRFLYFSDEQIRQLLKSLYVDVFRIHLIHKIRHENQDSLDSDFIENEFNKELKATRFIGMGNPSESGSHLLYFFRQENSLSKQNFIHGHEARTLSRLGKSGHSRQKVFRYVFIDDFCGTGHQAETYSKELISEIITNDSDAECWYCPLVSTEIGLKHVEGKTQFIRVESVLKLDYTFKSFSDESRYFAPDQKELKDDAMKMCKYYGELLETSEIPDCTSMGFGDSQLLIGFYHNTPDNTLPIFWADAKSSDFVPIFHRYPKIY